MYLKAGEARQLAARYRSQFGYGRTTDSVLLEKSRFATEKTYDVFLSHSFSDAEIILGVAKFIEDQGKTVYVDWIVDKGLDRSNVNANTAALLRTRMRASKSLIYASSDNSSKSKWMPWELGYFDGFRPEMVSILPIVEHSDSEWKGQEYLGLYPVIRRLSTTSGDSPFVVKSDKSAMRLSSFGNSTDYYWRESHGRATL